jgi:Plasma-membrane choline transporter
MTGLSIAGFLSSLGFAMMIWRRRSLLVTHAKIVGLAFDVLRIKYCHLTQPFFICSFGTTHSRSCFIHAAVGVDVRSGTFWMNQVLNHDDTDTFYLPAFFVGMFIWTSAIFQNLERITVSSVVGEWYFLRFEKSMSGDVTYTNLTSDGTTSDTPSRISARSALHHLYSAWFERSRLLLDTSKGYIYLTKHQSRSSFIVSIFEFVNSMVDRFSTYSLAYVGLTGDSYSHAAYLCTRLFRRNLVAGLVTSVLSRLLHLTTRVLIAASIGLVIMNRQEEKTGTEWVTGMLAMGVPFYVTGVLTHVVESTIDAVFVAFMVDLDEGSCHSEGAHQIFSASLK